MLCTILCIRWPASSATHTLRASIPFASYDAHFAPGAPQVFDGYIVKYFASVVALLVYAAPLYFRDPALRASQADLTQARPMIRQSPGFTLYT